MLPDQDKEMAKLPPEVRARVEALVKSDSRIAGISVERVKCEEMGPHDHEDEKKTPIRTVKMTPKVLKKVREAIAWKDKVANPALQRLNAAVVRAKAEADKIYRESDVVKEGFWALIAVEMGLSSKKYEMDINEKTGEVEIMSVRPGHDGLEEDKKPSKKK